MHGTCPRLTRESGTPASGLAICICCSLVGITDTATRFIGPKGIEPEERRSIPGVPFCHGSLAVVQTAKTKGYRLMIRRTFAAQPGDHVNESKKPSGTSAAPLHRSITEPTQARARVHITRTHYRNLNVEQEDTLCR